MDKRKLKKYTICGYYNLDCGAAGLVEQLLDVREVKGVLAAENITKLWEETGRFSRVTFYPTKKH